MHQGASADSEITLVSRGEAGGGGGTMARPMQRAAVTDTATEAPKNAWSRARATDLTGSIPPPHLPPPLLMSHGALRPEGTTSSKTQRAALKEHQSLCVVLWAEDRTTDSTRPQIPEPWPPRAPQGRAARRTRAPVSWIRLPTSLEETKRKGPR